MVAADEDALICDLAETYHVMNYKELPVKLLATLACGLRENSRIKMKMSNSKLSLQDVMLAAIKDDLSFLTWAQTKDGARGRNRPKSILCELTGENKEKKNAQIFASGNDFRKAWCEIAGKEVD